MLGCFVFWRFGDLLIVWLFDCLVGTYWNLYFLSVSEHFPIEISTFCHFPNILATFLLKSLHSSSEISTFGHFLSTFLFKSLLFVTF